MTFGANGGERKNMGSLDGDKNRLLFKYNSKNFRWESELHDAWIKVTPFASENLETRIVIHLAGRNIALEAKFDPEGFHVIKGKKRKPDNYRKPGYWESEIHWDLYGLYSAYTLKDHGRFEASDELRRGIDCVESVLWQCTPHNKDIPFNVISVKRSGKLADAYVRGTF